MNTEPTHAYTVAHNSSYTCVFLRKYVYLFTIHQHPLLSGLQSITILLGNWLPIRYTIAKRQASVGMSMMFKALSIALWVTDTLGSRSKDVIRVCVATPCPPTDDCAIYDVWVFGIINP